MEIEAALMSSVQFHVLPQAIFFFFFFFCLAHFAECEVEHQGALIQ